MSLKQMEKPRLDTANFASPSAVQVRGLDLNARERIRSAIIGKGGPKAVSQKSGIPLSTLTQVLSGRSEPKARLLATIADAVDVSLDWIMRGKSMPHGHGRDEASAPSEAKTDIATVPYYDVRASAGPGSMPLDEKPKAMFELDRRLMRILGVSAGNAAFLTVEGDSGLPTIGDGDGLLIDRSITHLRDGGLYVIGIDEDVVIKRVSRQADRSVLLMSDNPAYAPQHVPPEAAGHLRVVGRARWAIRSVP